MMEPVVELERHEFNRRNSYVNHLNEKLPIFIAMLQEVVSDQQEQYINHKITYYH